MWGSTPMRLLFGWSTTLALAQELPRFYLAILHPRDTIFSQYLDDMLLPPTPPSPTSYHVDHRFKVPTPSPLCITWVGAYTASSSTYAAPLIA